MTISNLHPAIYLPTAVALALLAAPATVHPQAKRPPELRPLPCSVIGACPRLARRLTFPAHALSYAGAGISEELRGYSWTGTGGRVSPTVRRPPDHAGGPVRVVPFHEVRTDEEGDIGFSVEPLGMRDGGFFELYGSKATNMRPANAETTYAQSVTFAPGDDIPFNRSADWWYFDVGRLGTYDGRIVLMSVAIEY